MNPEEPISLSPATRLIADCTRLKYMAMIPPVPLIKGGESEP